MNHPHKNARTTPLGRAEMVRRIVEEGRPVVEVAAGFGISERTARKWLARWRAEGAAGLAAIRRPLPRGDHRGRCALHNGHPARIFHNRASHFIAVNNG
ncbi:leucine zipper domain-containing protein [Chelatococcus sp. SYSU_G07232]|uniref:Leucine zipper domain-containing protein n=1 Tax=Chelatococcus albus TaxID=3047466 RepID=A0ABT7AKQ1_9HYPH|nr:leucine zipper domain-containing protein [Chelatococcus sp. SYSU_G07232]MDJ1159960.1 leucine zipper domain-containing protein [Chelatococcus sp. SYSU_G07232]